MELPVDPTNPCPGPPAGEVSLTRTSSGWAVVFPSGTDAAADLVEGMTLADLVSEECGLCVEPDRSARRSARGPAAGDGAAEDPRDARIVALERTVAQLEHALAARVSIERAIGVLAERNGVPPRTAFDELRGSARSQGRPVATLAREVLDSLVAEPEPARPQPAPTLLGPGPVPRPVALSRDAEGSVAGGRR